ncbi:hypothetical protein SAMN02745135_01739 [Caloranaerobacter azorensis DSM 13643]|uniref:Uncharacterized protein n=1 Tax=Caloranaerobacter azorensis DSM 13643 TaxID=1121264 RepID=A0A1M5V4U0_9FIRM|nr:hypothetical protein [Caloranaerobacter azorensis]SHH70190.1 hypothetical protein SAMN02745135_01739 [Caloranaerobacter azorensis DSM 13643]
MPKDYEIISYYNSSSFNGDGIRYHVFLYKKHLTDKGLMDFNNKRNKYIEKEINNILDSIELKKDRIYKTDSKDNSVIYLIYMKDTKKIYVIENIV